MNRSTRRQLPVVFRIAFAILFISLVAGQIWQRQPGGRATRAILGMVQHHCPAASRPAAAPSVANGARALDRWSLRLIVNFVDGDGMNRCGRAATAKSKGEGNRGEALKVDEIDRA